MKSLTFRNSKIIYYGPHECSNCGVLVAKMGLEWGGNTFTYPRGPIYPNTEWHAHVCDPSLVNEKPRACDVQQQPSNPIGPKGSVYCGDDGRIVGVSDGTKMLSVGEIPE